MKVIDIDIINKDKKLDKRDLCDSCYEVATKLIKYQVGDKEQKITRVERYCQTHYEFIINKQ